MTWFLRSLFSRRNIAVVTGITLLGVSSVGAQPPAPTPVPVVPRANQPGAPVGAETIAPINDDNQQKMPATFFGELALEVFLRQYQELTGKIIIWAPEVAQDQTIKLDSPPGQVMMTPQEQVDLIEQTLLLNNYTLIPAGENSVKLINTNNQPRNQAPPVYGTTTTLPDGEVLATYFMTFDHISATEAQTVFTAVLPRNAYGEVTVVPNANGLLISENTEVIRRMIELKGLIDIPSARVTTEFVELQRADAERVAETILQLLEDRESETATPAQQQNQRNRNQQQGQDGQPPMPPGLAEAAGANAPEVNAVLTSMSERDLVPGDVKLIPDPRTNSILVVTRPTNMPIIRELIQAFDRPIELELPYERQLYYRKANVILPILVNVLEEEEAAGGGANIAGGAAAGSPGASNVGRNRGGGGAGDSNIGGAGLEAQEEIAPESVVVGKTLLIADNTSNSIFISGPKENIDKVDKIISKLDVRGKQVYLATVIGQLTLSDDTETGVTYLQKFADIDTGIYNGGVASSLVAGAPATDPRLLVDTEDFFDVAGSGLNIYGTIVGSLDAFVAAISRTSRFKTIGRPNLFTANNRPATIASGRREPVPTSTVSNLVSGDSTAVNASIGFEDVELSIEIVPLINANREVTLDIYQRNDTVQERIEIAGSQVPVIATQELRTTVTVPDRSTIVLGGLISETESYNESGIPVLKDIPLLGGLFKSTNDETQRSELIILIQPSVIETEADLYYANFVEQRRNAVSDDARQLMRGENPEVRRAIPIDPAYLTPPAPANTQRPVTSKSMVSP